MNLSVLQPTSRPTYRNEVSFGCQHCAWLSLCGGNYTGTHDCLSYCCGNHEDCTLCCPRANGFQEAFRDSDGLDPYRKWDIKQTPELDLQSYVPCLQHSSSRAGTLGVQYAAIPTFVLYSHTREGGVKYKGASDLRRKFGLDRHCRVIASTIGPDAKLENYWRYRHEKGYLLHLARLGLTHIIAPNFSMACDTVRTDHLANRKRSLICAEEFSNAGISVIPYLAAVTEYDWEVWRWFLLEHPEISLVCKEFQTGGANPGRGSWHVQQLLKLERDIGRPLHVVGIAGKRQLPALRAAGRVTIIDSNPFSKTMHRQELVTGNAWVKVSVKNGRPLTKLLSQNIEHYSAMIGDKFATQRSRNGRAVVDSLSVPDSPQRKLGFKSTKEPESVSANLTVSRAAS
jgi:hypothetical protein